MVTGDVGAGKTTIVRSLLDKLDRGAGGRRQSRQHADRCRGHAAPRRVVVRPAHEGHREVGSAAVARSVPGLGEPAGQARAPHRRRSAEPDAPRRRGAAHAVEFPARDARAPAELPRRPAGVQAHDAEPADAAAAPARDRRVPHRTARRRRDPRLHRASAEVRRMEGRARSSSPAPTKASTRRRRASRAASTRCATGCCFPDISPASANSRARMSTWSPARCTTRRSTAKLRPKRTAAAGCRRAEELRALRRVAG